MPNVKLPLTAIRRVVTAQIHVFQINCQKIPQFVVTIIDYINTNCLLQNFKLFVILFRYFNYHLYVLKQARMAVSTRLNVIQKELRVKTASKTSQLFQKGFATHVVNSSVILQENATQFSILIKTILGCQNACAIMSVPLLASKEILDTFVLVMETL